MSVAGEPGLPGLQKLPGEGETAGVFWASAGIALLIEAVALTLAGWNGHWMVHPKKSADTSNFIEAQVYEAPKETHLVDQAKPVAAPARHEVTLSKIPNHGRQAKPEESKIQEENQTESGPKYAPTHGPIAIFSPPPVIPSYMQDRDLKASVVIDFLVSGQGNTTPRLVGSSGDEELDAIALAAVKKWQFRPAESDHHPIDSKVRLRIVFEVK